MSSVQAAQCHDVLAHMLLDDASLRGVAVVERERASLAQAGDEIRVRAAQMLTHALESGNVADAAVALQVFHNLGELPRRVAAVLEQIGARIDHAATAIGTRTAHTDASSARASVSLWTQLETWSDEAFTGVMQCELLQRALSKRRDETSRRSLLAELLAAAPPAALPMLASDESGGSLPRTLWRSAVRVLESRIERVAGDAPDVVAALVGEYPRALRVLIELLRRVRTQFALKHRVPLLPSDAHWLLASVARFRTPSVQHVHAHAYVDVYRVLRYLQRSWERLYGVAQAAFAGDGSAGGGKAHVPRAEQVLALSKLIADELDRSAATAALTAAVRESAFGVRWCLTACVGDRWQRALRARCMRLWRRPSRSSTVRRQHSASRLTRRHPVTRVARHRRAHARDAMRCCSPTCCNCTPGLSAAWHSSEGSVLFGVQCERGVALCVSGRHRTRVDAHQCQTAIASVALRCRVAGYDAVMRHVMHDRKNVALDDVMRCADQLLAPLFNNFLALVDASLLDMHRMSFASYVRTRSVASLLTNHAVGTTRDNRLLQKSRAHRTCARYRRRSVCEGDASRRSR
jgi:hypothetical protein